MPLGACLASAGLLYAETIRLGIRLAPHFVHMVRFLIAALCRA